jgi:acyl carrier protein
MTQTAVMEVRQLLSSITGSEVVDSIGDDDLFFEDRTIDSLHLIEIIDRFQTQLGVEVNGEDLSPENFGSIRSMARFLAKKRGTTEPGID